LRRDLRRLLDMRLLWGVAIAVGIPACWYVLAVISGGDAFVEKQLLNENLRRFIGAGRMRTSHSHPFYYYIGGLFAGFTPWSLFLPGVAVFLYRKRRELAERELLYPLVWFAVIFLFYSAASSKRTVYLLPLYPAMAMLTAAWWTDLAQTATPLSERWRGLWVRVATAVAAVLSIAALLIFAEGIGLPVTRLAEPFLHGSDRATLAPIRQALLASRIDVAAWAVLAVALLASLPLVVRRQRWTVLFATIAAVVVATSVLFTSTIHPAISRSRSFEPFMREVGEFVKEGDDLSFYKAFDYGVVFYARRHVPRSDTGLGPPPDAEHGRYLLLWERFLNELPPAERARLQVVAESQATGSRVGHMVLARVVAAEPDS
jgi:hypothetical protein